VTQVVNGLIVTTVPYHSSRDASRLGNLKPAGHARTGDQLPERSIASLLSYRNIVSNPKHSNIRANNDNKFTENLKLRFRERTLQTIVIIGGYLLRKIRESGLDLTVTFFPLTEW
jgi:hypothetical protein